MELTPYLNFGAPCPDGFTAYAAVFSGTINVTMPAREHERRHPFLLSGWQPLGDRLLREVLISCHAIS